MVTFTGGLVGEASLFSADAFIGTDSFPPQALVQSRSFEI